MKEGRKTKDAPISENFNTDKTIKLNRAALAAAKKEAMSNARKAKEDDAERKRLRKEKTALERKIMREQLIKMAQKGLEATEEEAENERRELAKEAAEAAAKEGKKAVQEDEQSAYQMLLDMRYVYKKVDGRKKLKTLIASDDKQFVFMVKELMKIEAQLMSAKIRAKEDLNGGAQQTVFVVLKGLEGMPKMLDVTPEDDVDHRQIAAALTPEGSEYAE